MDAARNQEMIASYPVPSTFPNPTPPPPLDSYCHVSFMDTAAVSINVYPPSRSCVPCFALGMAYLGGWTEQLEDNPIIFCSDGFAVFTGYSKEEVEGRK